MIINTANILAVITIMGTITTMAMITITGTNQNLTMQGVAAGATAEDITIVRVTV